MLSAGLRHILLCKRTRGVRSEPRRTKMVELSRLAALPVSAWRRYQRSLRERALVASLDHLSDQTLRDIGLHRGDIRRAVHGGSARG
jgi:uncharacterized protein YjiS (DUF1127 family)